MPPRPKDVRRGLAAMQMDPEAQRALQRRTHPTDSARAEGSPWEVSLMSQSFMRGIVEEVYECTFNVDQSTIRIEGPHNMFKAGRTLLHEAIERGDVPLLEAAVKMGAALDYPCEATDPMYPKGCTPLLRSVIALSTVSHLQGEATPEFRDTFFTQHMRCLELLLAFGADTEIAMPQFSEKQLMMGMFQGLAPQLWKRTPLQIAALFANVRVAAALLRFGADADVLGGPSLQSLWGKGLACMRRGIVGPAASHKAADGKLEDAFAAAAAAPPQGGPARVHVGSRALLQGLVSAAELNGQRCQILMFDKEKQRWQVRVDGSGKEVSVAEAKLQPLVTPWRYVDRRCRCGSGQLLSECHGPPNQADLVRTTQASCLGPGHPLFRYSPGAPCPCSRGSKGKPVKPYGRCCWKKVSYYMDERTSSLHHSELFTAVGGTPAGDDLMELKRYHDLRTAQGAKPDDLLFPDAERLHEEMPRLLADPATYDSIVVQPRAPYQRPRSAAVYSAVLARIPDWFLWIDAHWRVPKPELLLQVEEWNREVEALAGERGLVGEERDKFLTEMGASPFAPCGNPKCLALETKVKGHKLCDGCKAIAYCTRDCQRQHWKAPGTESHKILCTKSSKGTKSAAASSAQS